MALESEQSKPWKPNMQSHTPIGLQVPLVGPPHGRFRYRGQGGCVGLAVTDKDGVTEGDSEAGGV